MSFFSDLTSGNFGNLGHDLAPSNFFDDTVKDIGGAHTLEDILGGVGLAAGGVGLAGLAGLDVGAGLAGLGQSAGLSSLGSVSTAAPLSLADADAGVAGVGGSLGDAGAAGAAGATTPSLGGFDLSTIGAGAAPSAGTPDWLTSATFGTGVSPTDATSAFGANPLATATSPVTAGAAGTAASSPSLLSSIGSGISSVGGALKTAAPVIGLAGLGANLYSGYEQNQQLKALNAQEQQNAAQAASISATDTAAAQPLLTSGESLTQYLATGTLPPAFQATLQQNIAAAKARIIQGYATRGMSTNPNQNSQLAQDLNNVDLQGQTVMASLESTLNTAGTQLISTANGLLSSGLSALQISAELPIQVAKLNSDLNAQMATAISGFAAALNGSGTKSGVTLTLPNNVVTPSGGLNLG
jgi:hypothetical protein